MIELPDTTTEQGQCEASVILARLCGWEYRNDEITGQWYSEIGELLYDEWKMDTGGYGDVTFLSLYNLANMALAWRVLNWLASLDTIHYTLRLMNIWAFEEWAKLPPAAAQRAWLDKILQLANEAGMLDATTKEGE